MTYILLIIGLALLLAGANFLVDSSVAIAKRAKISDFVIGLTIIGMGTSAPELFISVSSAINGYGDVALGNVLGSNICNTMLILGITSLIAPVAIERSNLRRDIPLGVLVSVLLCVLCYVPLAFGASAGLTRWAAIILLIGFIAFMIMAFSKGNNKNEEYIESDEVQDNNIFGKQPILVLILIAIVSLGALLYGGNLFLDSAINIAKLLGMSESVIAITVIAVGTSLPELITCIIAALKGNSQLALGNVLGSNIFNILLILGVAALIKPLQLNGIGVIDFVVLIASAALTFIFAFTLRRRIIDRAEGAIFVVGYIGYSIYLLVN